MLLSFSIDYTLKSLTTPDLSRIMDDLEHMPSPTVISGHAIGHLGYASVIYVYRYTFVYTTR